MNRVVHFEINSDNPKKAANFYKNVFGWKFTKWEGPMDYWMIKTGARKPGIDGGLMHRMDINATTHNIVDVTSADRSIKAIEKNSGKIVVPKRAIPGVGYMAYFEDIDGNVLGIMKHNKRAT